MIGRRREADDNNLVDPYTDIFDSSLAPMVVLKMKQNNTAPQSASSCPGSFESDKQIKLQKAKYIVSLTASRKSWVN